MKGATAPPIEEPLSNSAVASARSRFGNHSETAFVAAGQLADSPAPNKKRKSAKGVKTIRQRRQHGDDRIPDHGERQAAPCADAIHKSAEGGLPDGISHTESDR